MSARIRSVIAIVGVLILSAAAAHAEDAVLKWNRIAVNTLVTQPAPGLNPFQQARFAAIIQLAVFETVNAITGEYEPYLGSPVAPARPPIVASFGASAEAAAITAAYDVLVHYFPGSAGTLTTERNNSLAAITDAAAKAAGVAVGDAAAAALIAERAIDGSTPLTFSVPSTVVGKWDITPAHPGTTSCPTDTLGNYRGGTLFNWKDVRPFGVVVPAAGDWTEAFRPEPPPDLTSNLYTKDYNEVKAVGGSVGADRPADRALVARFYAASSPTYLFFMVARQLAEARGDSLSENARALALIAMATNDSLVASFATKYYYNYWRPVTAIRRGDEDNNAKTDQNISFLPFINTPCFPSYPSNHASGSNGAAETLRRLYGAAGHTITLSNTIPVAGAVELHYTSLQQICDDIDDARVYGGIHFRFDQVAGVGLGRKIATEIYKSNLQPIHP